MKFEVKFYYYTDLRDLCVVEAANEVEALVLAFRELRSRGMNQLWCSGRGFRIEIKEAE